MGGTLLPAADRRDRRRTSCIAGWRRRRADRLALAVVAWRTQRDHPTLVRLAVGAAVLFAIQVVIGGAQVLTRLAEWTQTLHLALGAVIWAMLAGLVVTSYYTARVGAGAGGRRRHRADREADGRAAHDRATRSARTSR